MRRHALALAVVVCCGTATVSWAGPFGGFSEDHATFLNGTEQVCRPLVVDGVDSVDAPSCERAQTAAIAGAKYRKGDRQAGASGYRARGQGTRIHLFAPGEDEPRVRWNAGGVVSRVVAVYAVDDGAVVAVEFETRRFGRLETDAVAFRLRAVDGAQPQPGGDVPRPEQGDAITTARERADRLAGKRKWKDAERAYREVLELDERDPAARYGLAVALARRNKLNEALRELRALAAASAGDDRVVVWLYEARTDKAFRKLRKRSEFRRAVGLERAEGEPLTAYERLLAPSKGWEQARVACEQAGIRLRLDRREHGFRLAISTECQGYDETLRLDGTWRAQGARYLILTFPNVDGPDETTRCEVRACTDGSGEDCLSCQVDPDLGFTLRPIRR